MMLTGMGFAGGGNRSDLSRSELIVKPLRMPALTRIFSAGHGTRWKKKMRLHLFLSP